MCFQLILWDICVCIFVCLEQKQRKMCVPPIQRNQERSGRRFIWFDRYFVCFLRYQKKKDMGEWNEKEMHHGQKELRENWKDGRIRGTNQSKFEVE